MIEVKPRGKGKNNKDYGRAEIYDKYVEDNYHRETITKYDIAEKKPLVVSRELFWKIWKDYIDEWIRKILYEGERYKLPYGLGGILIIKRKMKIGPVEKGYKLALDYKKWRETGKKIFLLNEHRNNCRYTIRWEKRTMRPIQNKGAYFFLPIRPFKRELAHILKTNFDIDYLSRDYKVRRKPHKATIVNAE